eukprot:gene2042-2364_t
MGWPFWDTLLCDPTAFKVPPTKAELIIRIMGAFKLASPTSMAPAQVVASVVQERSNYGYGRFTHKVVPPYGHCQVVLFLVDSRCAPFHNSVHSLDLANRVIRPTKALFERGKELEAEIRRAEKMAARARAKATMLAEKAHLREKEAQSQQQAGDPPGVQQSP